MNICLGDIRFLINENTKVYLICENEALEISDNNLLWGTTGFSEIPVDTGSIRAVRENHIEIKTTMPYTVFKAWCEYAREV